MTQELYEAREEKLDYLNEIIKYYNGSERKGKKVLLVFCVIAAFLAYFFLTDILGGTLGYIATIIILSIGIMCANMADINLNTKDAQLAYNACVTMEMLIRIDNGTYHPSGINVSNVSSGKHRELYKQFVQHYPNCECKELERLSKINISYKDL